MLHYCPITDFFSYPWNKITHFCNSSSSDFIEDTFSPLASNWTVYPTLGCRADLISLKLSMWVDTVGKIMLQADWARLSVTRVVWNRWATADQGYFFLLLPALLDSLVGAIFSHKRMECDHKCFWIIIHTPVSSSDSNPMHCCNGLALRTFPGENPGNLSGKKAILTQAVGTSILTKSAFRTMVPCSIAKITLIHSIDGTQQDISLTCKTQLR